MYADLDQKGGMRHPFIVVAAAAVVSLFAAASGCHRGSGSAADRPCAAVSGKLAEQLLKQYPFDQIDPKTRDWLRRAWGDDGKVCLTGTQQPQSCNSGSARDRQDQICCHLESPAARLSGLPEKIEIQDDAGGPPLVDLVISPVLSNLAENRHCSVPTCEADVVAGDGLIRVEGTVRVGKESVKVSLQLQPEERLQLQCALP